MRAWPVRELVLHDHHVETFEAARYFIHLKYTSCSIADRVADVDSLVKLLPVHRWRGHSTAD